MKTKPIAALCFAATLMGCGGGLQLPIPSAGGDLPAHPGFDTWQYPGDAVMSQWRESSPYRWVGYYLPAPCHRDESFSGRRAFLERTGWGIAVLYVGQQTFDGEAPAELTETTVCSSLLLTSDRGAVDARDAIARTTAEGFPPGTTIFLDVERMQTVTPAMIDYYQAWLREVLRDGRYHPGTYAHVANAAALYTTAQRVLQQGGATRDIPFWIAGGSGFSLSSRPTDSGARYAEIWQGVLDVDRTWGRHTLRVDENVATTASPSAPVPPT